jgi:hypothetical protein
MAELGRYLRWWVHENRWDRFILIVPFLLLGFPVAVVNNLMHGRPLAALGSFVLIAVALVMLSLDFLRTGASGPGTSLLGTTRSTRGLQGIVPECEEEAGVSETLDGSGFALGAHQEEHLRRRNDTAPRSQHVSGCAERRRPSGTSRDGWSAPGAASDYSNNDGPKCRLHGNRFVTSSVPEGPCRRGGVRPVVERTLVPGPRTVRAPAAEHRQHRRRA